MPKKVTYICQILQESHSSVSLLEVIFTVRISSETCSKSVQRFGFVFIVCRQITHLRRSSSLFCLC